MAENPPLIAIVGPTAVGKTGLAVRLARAVGGEIVSADSRQVYRGMAIGTAQPTDAERAAVPHHLFGFLDPDEVLTLATYQEMAYAAIDDIHCRGRVPFLVGGSGQYVRAVLEGWGIPAVAPDEPLRADLHGFADVYGAAALHEWLARVDPSAASRIDYRNVRRVVRALEVWVKTGTPISVLQERTPPPYRTLVLGLTRSRDALYERVDRRIDEMMAGGLEAEVRALLDAGYGWDLPSMSSLGYAQFAAAFAGDEMIADAVEAIRHDTRRFVRQQANWFKPDDPSVHWFDLGETGEDAILEFVRGWLAAA